MSFENDVQQEFNESAMMNESSLNAEQTGSDSIVYRHIFKNENKMKNTVKIPKALFDKLSQLGLIPDDVRSFNVGESDYSKHIIQPWAIWQDYDLNPWDADLVKRILRTKKTDSRKMDYEKMIHICQERIRQIDSEGKK